MGDWEQDEHNRGQDEGSANGAGGHLMQELFWRHVESDDFNKGYDNGRNNPSSDDSSSSGSGSSGSGGCYITSACVRAGGLPDNCDELKALRRFRDEVMLATPEGRMLVQQYYIVAPRIVARVDQRSDARSVWAGTLSSVRSIVALVESGRNRDAIDAYRAMTATLASL